MPTLAHADKSTKELDSKLTFRTTSELSDRVYIAARRLKTSMQAFCVSAIEKELDRVEPKLARKDTVSAA